SKIRSFLSILSDFVLMPEKLLLWLSSISSRASLTVATVLLPALRALLEVQHTVLASGEHPAHERPPLRLPHLGVFLGRHRRHPSFCLVEKIFELVVHVTLLLGNTGCSRRGGRSSCLSCSPPCHRRR